MRFADTSFWVALQMRRDPNHDMARRLWEADSAPVLVSNHVVGETWTFLRRRAGHTAAVAFVDALERSRRVTVAQATPETESEAWRWLRRRDEREYSFVDAVSFACMRSRRIREALAFDGDFAAAGFVEVRP